MRIPTEVAAMNKLRIGGLLRMATGLSAREKRQRVWGAIYQTEKSLGTQFIKTRQDGRLYTILGRTNDIVPLPANTRGGDELFGYIFEMYGLDRMDPLAQSVYEHFRTQATTEGIRADLRRFAAYDTTTRTCYMSTYNGRMLRLDGGEIESVVSGDDGMFFLDDDGGISIEPDITNHGILIDLLTNLNFATGPGGITPEQQRRLFIVWIFALAFPDLFPDKPIMLLEGVMGAGKTAAPKLIQRALLGQSKIMSIAKDQEKDFGVLLLRNPIAILDNMDSFIDWVQDKVCQYATGGTFTKRKLFSDDDEIEIRPQSFVAITSRNPSSFRREDVVDRLLIIRLKRYTGGFRAMQKIEAEIDANRTKLLGEYVYYVNKIVEVLRQGAIDADKSEKWRMASFAQFTRAVGQVFEWGEASIEEMLDAMQGERDVFAGEDDPLVEIMQEWIAYKIKGQLVNVGREVPLTELFKALSGIAATKGIKFYKHHVRLAERLGASHINRYFKIESRTSERNGTRLFKIWRTNDPILGVVDGDGISADDFFEGEIIPNEAKPAFTIRVLGSVPK